MKQDSAFRILWLTIPICILLAAASGSGLFAAGLYWDVPGIIAQSKGQDLVSLVAVLPIIMITAGLAWRGSLPAYLIWLGGMVYLVYTYIIFAFHIRYNALFLVYIALLGCSLYALIGGMTSLDFSGIQWSSQSRAAARVVSIFMAMVAVLFYFIWLSEAVPAMLSGQVPQSVLEEGTPTNGIHVVDMAWILPAFGIAAVSLWRRHALGYGLAGILLSFIVMLASAVLSMVAFQALGGSTEIIEPVVIFGSAAAIAAGLLAWYLKSLHNVPGRDITG